MGTGRKNWSKSSRASKYRRTVVSCLADATLLQMASQHALRRAWPIFQWTGSTRVWYPGCPLRTISVFAISGVHHFAADHGSIVRRFGNRRCSESLSLGSTAVDPMCLHRHCRVETNKKLLLRARLAGDLGY